jgi:internalin A
MLLFLQNTSVESRPRQAFISYSHCQETWKDRLMDALRPLEEQRQIVAWHDRKLLPGQPWDGVIREELDRSDLLLLLVGPDFINSSYCRDVEVRRAVERAETGDAVLIPIIIGKL